MYNPELTQGRDCKNKVNHWSLIRTKVNILHQWLRSRYLFSKRWMRHLHKKKTIMSRKGLTLYWQKSRQSEVKIRSNSQSFKVTRVLATKGSCLQMKHYLEKVWNRLMKKWDFQHGVHLEMIIEFQCFLRMQRTENQPNENILMKIYYLNACINPLIYWIHKFFTIHSII